MAAIVANKVASGASVVLLANTPCSATVAKQQAMINALYGVQSVAGLNLIDDFQRWGSGNSYAILNAAGFMGNPDHPSAFGYGDVANTICDQLPAA